MKEKTENPMREILVDKITLNIGAGADMDKVDNALTILSQITKNKPVKTTSRERIQSWKIRVGLPIAAKVTIRGKEAAELLPRLLTAITNTLNQRKFDDFGNFSFGIKEYIDIPGMKYNSKIGIIGMEAAVTLKRRGFRVKSRKLSQAKIGKHHRITKQESMDFMKQKYKINIEE